VQQAQWLYVIWIMCWNWSL